ncbi:hypothetical protein TGAMA5MH_03598 [Trichoderma gamsii]|nr:hypothetical protein TGAMA5MH_03598 [Trichoderma gamsii]
MASITNGAIIITALDSHKHKHKHKHQEAVLVLAAALGSHQAPSPKPKCPQMLPPATFYAVLLEHEQIL